MANSTDPFGKSMFGGMTSIPGQTSMPVAKPATAAYQYAGKGWTDPLAQEIAQKYLHDPSRTPNMWNPAGADDSYRRLKGLSDMYHAPGTSTDAYIDPLDPKNFQQGGVYTADQAQQMRDEYISRGGQGTAEQLAGTYQTPEAKVANEALVKAGGSGSTHSLSPDILQKMWR